MEQEQVRPSVGRGKDLHNVVLSPPTPHGVESRRGSGSNKNDPFSVKNVNAPKSDSTNTTSPYPG